MTTVVYDGRVLAADSQGTMTGGNWDDHDCGHCGNRGLLTTRKPAIKLSVMDSSDPKPFFREQRIAAMAILGNIVAAGFMANHITSGGDPAELLRLAKGIGGNFNGVSWTLILVTERAVWEVGFTRNKLEVIEHPLGEYRAWGSGAIAANVGHSLGSTARECVIMAISADPYTGGNVQWVDTHAPYDRKDYCVQIDHMSKAALESITSGMRGAVTTWSNARKAKARKAKETPSTKPAPKPPTVALVPKPKDPPTK